MQVTVRVPAGSANLGPGFDSLGLALQIYNELTLSISHGPLSAVQIKGEGAAGLPRDGSNLSLQAADLLFRSAGLQPPFWDLQQFNGIPIAAGAGSSAAAIVGGMIAANAFLPRPLGREQILELAVQMEGHPDNIAPALYGGLIVSGSGQERINICRFEPAPSLRLLLAVPEITLSTSAARKALPPLVAHGDAAFNAGRAAALTGALITGKEEALRWATEDRLHQPYRYPLIPGAEAALAAALAAGAGGAAISGAGPSIIALWFKRGESDNREPSISNAIREAYAAGGIGCRLIPAIPDLRGAHLLP